MKSFTLKLTTRMGAVFIRSLSAEVESKKIFCDWKAGFKLIISKFEVKKLLFIIFRFQKKFNSIYSIAFVFWYKKPKFIISRSNRLNLIRNVQEEKLFSEIFKLKLNLFVEKHLKRFKSGKLIKLNGKLCEESKQFSKYRF